MAGRKSTHRMQALLGMGERGREGGREGWGSTEGMTESQEHRERSTRMNDSMTA